MFSLQVGGLFLFFLRSFTVVLLYAALITKDECKACCAVEHPFGAIYFWTKNGLNLVQGTKQGVTTPKSLQL